METLSSIVGMLEYYIWQFGPQIGNEAIPVLVIVLLGTGLFLTLRFGFLQFRQLAHGCAVASGRYDNSDEPGDVPHFQALTTALSATVGIGNIAGVAMAIHFGGPGALFWMWVTAVLGMATKFTEVTLAHHYRLVQDPDVEAHGRFGKVSGGPMYYIEKGLGPKWKPLAVLFAFSMILTSFLTGNGIQANTVADLLFSEFGMPVWLTGILTSGVLFLVIVGGIKRIGAVTSVLAPLMAAVYFLGAFVILAINYDRVLPTFLLIFQEAFHPSAGVAGTGAGVFVITMMWGVRRGLFSNEAGQGSAPIAHSAAKTDEPVSEGVVALLEPFIDTIIICSMTALVILITGVWNERIPTEFQLSSGDISYIRSEGETGLERTFPEIIHIEDGRPREDGKALLAWHDVVVEVFFLDPSHSQTFTGDLYPRQEIAIDESGTVYATLFGLAVENGAPLTALAFQRGLLRWGSWGNYVVLISVLLFAMSTAISWSYYGDRCVNYLFGARAILPYKIVFVLMHFTGAIFALSTVWTLGDVALGLVTFPNLIALVLLSGVVGRLTKSYFQRRPWLERNNLEKN